MVSNSKGGHGSSWAVAPKEEDDKKENDKMMMI
jgi:hypothetical protein